MASLSHIPTPHTWSKAVERQEYVVYALASLNALPPLCQTLSHIKELVPMMLQEAMMNNSLFVKESDSQLMRVFYIAVSKKSLFVTPWTVVLQAPLSMGLSRQEYWSGLSFPTPGDLSDPGIEPTSLVSPALQVNSLPLSHWGSSKKPLINF